jgi:hypothetical protein
MFEEVEMIKEYARTITRLWIAKDNVEWAPELIKQKLAAIRNTCDAIERRHFE